MGRPTTGDGLWQWYDMLAQTSRLEKSRCLGKTSPYHSAKYALYKEDRLDQSLY